MFSTAYGIVQDFTRPVVISTRTEDGKVNCGLGTFIIVNKDGWAVTAAHVVLPAKLHVEHSKARQELEHKRKAILDDSSLSGNRRKKAIAGLNPSPSWLTNHSFWWCADTAQFTEVYADGFADIAIVKLAGFDTSQIERFPRFKDPGLNPPPGGSLCRLGFPFAKVTAEHDNGSGNFTLKNFAMPPMFPNDGIHTRIVFDDQQPERVITLIETSTPGLMGQSGGPLFDTKGEIWGIQSKTHFLPLGFAPKTKDGAGKEVVEHQFMNLGLAVHVKHVVELFEKHGVSYDRA